MDTDSGAARRIATAVPAEPQRRAQRPAAIRRQLLTIQILAALLPVTG
jgi:hypothetical protein